METCADDEVRTIPEGLIVVRVQVRVGRREEGRTAVDEGGDGLTAADEDAGTTVDEEAEITAEEDNAEATVDEEGLGVGVGVGVGAVE